MNSPSESPAERFERLNAMVDDALRLPVEQRAQYLSVQCKGDGTLLAEAQDLLAVSLDPGFLESPLAVHSRVSLPRSLAGRTFGEFKLIEELARGGMGVVYRARQVGLERDVAVKVIANPILLTSDVARERFQREARSAAQLDHPHIAKVLTHGEQDGVPFLAMELIKGDTLAARIRAEGPPVTADARRIRCAWIRSVADALSAAHAAGIVHRDVKPQNILLGPGDSPKLVDFGVARSEHFGAISSPGELIGTPHYMSPEQLRAKANEVDERTDVYSLGVVLFETLTQERPYSGDSVMELIATIEHKAPRSLRGLNPSVERALEWIVQRAIEVEPARRYRTVAELRDDLDAFLETGTPKLAGPRSAWRLVSSLARRRRVALVASVVVVLVASVVALAFKAAPEPAVALSVDSEPDGATVVARRCDPRTGLLLAGEALRLGETPMTVALLPLGSWAVEATLKGQRIGEARVHVTDPASRVRLPKFFARERDEAMVRIPDGKVTLFGAQWEVAAFWIDPCEVTNELYLAFVRATGHRAPGIWPAGWESDGLPEPWLQRPVVDIDQGDAREFATWSGKRLPTWAEWVRAASGDEEFAYPFGNEFSETDMDPERANILWPGRKMERHNPMESSGVWNVEVARAGYLRETLPVSQASEHRSPFQLERVLGNVREWTSTPFCRQIEGAWRPVEQLVQLGGCSWQGDLHALHVQAPALASTRSELIGLRCARSCAPHDR